jgi:hypothetical protein
MGKTKDDIWSKFGQSYKHGNVKSSCCKCLACDDLVIATAGHMRDHWAKCKKRPHAIGQLDAGFQPSRKLAKTWTVQSSSVHSSASNVCNTVGELVKWYIFNWGGLWLLYNTIWYYTILYGIIPHSIPKRTVINLIT